MALYPFGQGFSAVLASWLLPDLGASEANAPPTVATFHILAAPPSWHHRAGCSSALRTTWDNCCRCNRVGGPVEELALHRPCGPLDWTVFIPSLPLSLASSMLAKGCYLEANVPQCPLGSHHIWKEAGFVPGHETLFGAGGQAAENIHF